MPFCKNIMDCALFKKEATRCHYDNDSCFMIKPLKSGGVQELPPFLGMVCKHCGKPFMIWKTEFESVKCDDPDFESYLNEGHTVKVIAPETVGDLKMWCDDCQNNQG